MIEIVMLMLLGNSDMLFELQTDIDEQTELVTDMELRFEELKEVRTATEIRMNVLFAEYKQYEKEEDWDNSKTRQDFVEFKSRETKDQWRVEYRDLKVILKQYNELEHELETAKTVLESMEKDFVNLTKANSDPDRYVDVSVSLSKNCKTMIKYDMHTNCPTIRELFDTFDNTDDTVSGVMVDDGFHDVQRVDIMKKHWKFYKDMNDFNLIMVDPDADFQRVSINVEVQAREFQTLSLMGSNDARSFSDNQFTIWKNFKVTDNCKRILVAPDMELIAQAVDFAQSKCRGDIDLESDVIERDPTLHEDKNWRDSPALVYQNWLKEAMSNNKQLRIGLD